MVYEYTSQLEKDVTYYILLHTFLYTLNDVVHNALEISVGLVISKSHHPPTRFVDIPMNLDDTIIDLLSRLLEPAELV